MISVIIPFYNEKENLETLIFSLDKELQSLKKPYEIILVDDGSTDGFKLPLKKKEIKLISHRKKLGKGEALKTGLQKTQGDIIFFMDADWQDHPSEIKKFLAKIEEGYHFVNGKRVNRQDNFLVKTYSFFANLFLKKVMRSPYSDINCGFKAFKKEVIKDFVFYGNNFRFFPLVVFYQGFKVGEVEVKNYPRRFGKSKFGSQKILIGIFDMITAYFLYKFSEKPIHFFGMFGFFIFSIGFLILMILAVERLFFGVLLYRRPILFLGLLLTIVGVQIISTGILGELIVYLNKKSGRERS